jgi:hypothetical protein
MDRTGKESGAFRNLSQARDAQRILGIEPISGEFRALVIDRARRALTTGEVKRTALLAIEAGNLPRGSASGEDVSP